MADEITTEEACEALTRYLEIVGEEVLEKHFEQGNRVLAVVYCVVGPNAKAFQTMVQEWLAANGFGRTS